MPDCKQDGHWIVQVSRSSFEKDEVIVPEPTEWNCHQHDDNSNQ